MVLVDTTVWIDFFSPRTSLHVKALEMLIEERNDICICGVVLTEVLQGIQNDLEYKKTKDLFNNLLFLPMSYQVFVHSSKIYRSLRKKGITIRNTVDCMIAAVAIESKIPLLHNDKDFIPIEKHCGLKVYKTKT
ncbi:MAG: PIN domain nuclease [Deltaproteobacteria bacterium]|nr:PIN domain nuclease [Deltaproteobacteria bacterium]